MLGADTLKRLKNKGKLHILENIRSGHYQTIKNKGKLHILENIRSGHYQTTKK